ncbi:uncharacterized protein LOC144108301 [Amblyomma americanum]
MGSQQFCLKRNNHQSNMLAVFYEMLSNEALVDVTLACEGLSLKAHKMVLSACSPFFQALFAENPCKHPIVILNDMRYVDLRAIVEFMYRGEVDVSQDDLMALLKTAETLKVKGFAGTNENKNGGLVTDVDGAADAGPVGSPRAEFPPLSKRKRSRRPRRRSPSDSNKSDSEDAPPATRIKVPDSPEIIEDGSMSSDRVTDLPAASPSSRASNVASSTAVPSGARHGSSLQASISQHTQDSIGDDAGEGSDADFDVEPLDVVEESTTTASVPVFRDVASSSQALGDESQQSHHTGSTSDKSALVPAQPSLPSDISIMSQVDIKPSPTSLTPYDDKTIAPVVAASPTAASSGDGASTAMAVTDASGVPAIAGPSGYQQSTPSHDDSTLHLQPVQMAEGGTYDGSGMMLSGFSEFLNGSAIGYSGGAVCTVHTVPVLERCLHNPLACRDNYGQDSVLGGQACHEAGEKMGAGNFGRCCPTVAYRGHSGRYN